MWLKVSMVVLRLILEYGRLSLFFSCRYFRKGRERSFVVVIVRKVNVNFINMV